MGKRRTFTEEFKTEACRLVIERGIKISEAAKDLGISQGILGQWVRKSRYTSPQVEQESKKIRELESENRKLRMERDILKKAITFFGGD